MTNGWTSWLSRGTGITCGEEHLYTEHFDSLISDSSKHSIKIRISLNYLECFYIGFN